MKKSIAIILVILVSIPAFSQIKWGLKAGVSTTSLSMPSVKTITSGTTSFTVEGLKSAKYGFNGGAFVRLTLLGVYIQPELLFSTRSNEYTVTNVTNQSSPVAYVAKQNFNKLEIPVMVGCKLGPIRLNAGPAASILINSPKDLITDSNFKNRLSTMTIGYQAGLGFDLLKLLTFDVRYEGSLKKYQNQIQALAGSGQKVNLDDRPNAFLFSVGIFF
jgi:hypothetical protein